MCAALLSERSSLVVMIIDYFEAGCQLLVEDVVPSVSLSYSRRKRTSASNVGMVGGTGVGAQRSLKLLVAVVDSPRGGLVRIEAEAARLIGRQPAHTVAIAIIAVALFHGSDSRHEPVEFVQVIRDDTPDGMLAGLVGLIQHAR